MRICNNKYQAPKKSLIQCGNYYDLTCFKKVQKNEKSRKININNSKILKWSLKGKHLILSIIEVILCHTFLENTLFKCLFL